MEGRILYQVIDVDDASVLDGALEIQRFVTELRRDAKRVLNVTAYTKDSSGAIGNTNCKVFDAIEIAGKKIYDKNFDTFLLAPVDDLNSDLRDVGLDYNVGARIRGSIQKDVSVGFIILLTLLSRE